MHSVPTATPFANAGLPAMKQAESFLGRGQLGERPSALPSMAMHQLGDQARFVVRPLLDWVLPFASVTMVSCRLHEPLPCCQVCLGCTTSVVVPKVCLS